MSINFDEQCRKMVALLRERGITDPDVLKAMRSVSREEFVIEPFRDDAYADSALPLTHKQTISQPYVVALMAQALRLRPTDRVLEIGTGSGYAAAIIGELAGEVYSVERVADLAITAAETIRRLKIPNVHVRFGDGTRGWEAEAPFDAISVAAGGEHVPSALMQQLAVGGRLVIPLGAVPESQRLVCIHKTGEGSYEEDDYGAVRFVPLLPETA